MPVNQPKFVDKAYLRNADAIVLDLEDSVPDNQKEMARTQVKDAIRAVKKGGSAVFVRVNPTSDHIEKDLRASIWPGLDGIVLPKLETKEQLQAVEQHITEIEHARGLPAQHIAVSAIVETVAGLTALPHSLEESQRLDSITLGAEDFSLDSGIELGEETESALTYARLQILFSAKQLNILPLGIMGSIATLADNDQYASYVRLAYKHGFVGSTCIHPSHVEVLNKGFSPSQEEVERAKSLIHTFEHAEKQGKASTTFEGKMIDIPHYKKALALLERHRAIEAFETEKAAARRKGESTS
ncbi:citrate lyase beta chain [Bacillus sp. JCM 19046]|nr:citrate lyase beta chain [Bacillus sp. JCM 19045]GAF19048.1 citrate lyase beta chain [Bacillus sp. JCM 19046]